MQEIVKLLSRLAASRDSIRRKKRELLKGFIALINADFWAQGLVYVPTGSLNPIILKGSTNLPLQLRANMIRSMCSRDKKSADPTFSLIEEKFGTSTHITITRQDIISDKDWYELPYYKNLSSKANLDHFLFTLYPLGDNKFTSLHIHRKQGKPPFSKREVKLLHFLIANISWMKEDQLLDSDEKFISLPPRLYETLLHVIYQGWTNQEIADAMGKSLYTVKEYMKDLQKHFNVKSRAELVAYFARAAHPKTILQLPPK
ncbi:MAG: LuxR C-terminal-related transcriptional regulator [Lentisphaerales bacterium]|nr:LuxR C-terminal-related transcriptional regulator [Lentisphaerales bacterium]